jgi:hypothetical protein
MGRLSHGEQSNRAAEMTQQERWSIAFMIGFAAIIALIWWFA